MARTFWRKYYKRKYGKRFGSFAKMRTTKNFKASANNMTQGVTLNISVHLNDHIDVVPNVTHAGFAKKLLQLGNLIYTSEMHNAMSTVFDQYRVEQVSIKIRNIGDIVNPEGSPSVNTVLPSAIFSCVDRSGFDAGIDIETLRTYGSYRETAVSGAKDVSPVHYINVAQSNLVEWSTYYDTKEAAKFPAVLYGCASAYVPPPKQRYYFSVEIDAKIRYRGTRLDKRTTTGYL